ncbi:hypothetical protein HZB90_00010 [archaeon]|nr:hypothetical protein [archaeon]
MADADSSKRQVAYKLHVSDLLNNRYVKEEGWLPNFIAVGDRKVSRVNLLGVVVSKSSQESDVPSSSFVLDDGTGSISLRFFESAIIDVGDLVNVIGRPREFGAERYIVPEVIRKVSDSRWVEVRKLELALDHRSVAPSSSPAADELLVETEDFGESVNPLVKIVSTIRELDSGPGVGFEEISVKLGDVNAEPFIKQLLEKGDIFEVKPGRYKVLE